MFDIDNYNSGIIPKNHKQVGCNDYKIVFTYLNVKDGEQSV